MNFQTGNWVESRSLGDVTEICVMSPVRLGRVPGERRTFEERLRFKVDSLMRRAESGLPNVLNRITTIHFARMLIIRPDQYLSYSGLPGFPPLDSSTQTPSALVNREAKLEFDPYRSGEQPAEDQPHYRSWLLTQVIFDGDIKVYFRDIAERIAGDFDDVFDNCEEFPGTSDFGRFWNWIRKYQIRNDLFLSAYPNLSVPRIKQLEDFKARFDAFVATVRSPTGRRVEPIDDLFDAFLKESQQYASGFPASGGVYLPKDIKE